MPELRQASVEVVLYDIVGVMPADGNFRPPGSKLGLKWWNHAEAGGVKKQILIVDDDQRMLDALRRTLHHQSDDWDMTFIRNPEEAWESLLQTAYDAVVTDVRMPGHDRHRTARTHPADRQDQRRAGGDSDRAERHGPEGEGAAVRRRRSAEQAGRRGPVDRPAAERVADEELRGRFAGEQRVAEREGAAAERRSGAVADERRLPAGHGGRVPR